MYTAEPATLEHAAALAAVIRAEDAAEIRKLGREPLEALEQSIAISREPVAVFHDGKILALFGVGELSLLSDEGTPWMVGSAAVPRHAKMLLTLSKAWVGDVRQQYSRLVNYVDKEYIPAVNWLRWLGFTIHPAEPFGPRAMPFHKFEMSNV